MFKKFLMSAFIVVVSSTFLPIDADAGRLGGGRSLGMQRSSPAVVNKTPTATTSPAISSPAATNPGALANNTANNKRSWAGPLAGLAAGLGLGMLFSHLGIGEGMGSILQILLLAGIAYFIYKLIIAKKQGSNYQAPLQYAGNTNYNANPGSTAPQIGSNIAGGAGSLNSAGSYPPGFNAENFVRAAKVNFIRLQTANDNHNLNDLREFTSPEMFAELKMDIEERGNRSQKTEVIDLDAQILEVVSEGGRLIASVLFKGKISEDGAMPSAFQEIWHMSKPADGSSGWVVVGIQV